MTYGSSTYGNATYGSTVTAGETKQFTATGTGTATGDATVTRARSISAIGTGVGDGTAALNHFGMVAMLPGALLLAGGFWIVMGRVRYQRDK